MRINLENKLTGVLVFALSITLYTLTLEPTTSFWDCSEFILSAAKLEVNHPAGAPLFMLLGRLFSFLSFGNPQRIAWTINFMSGFFSALTIFFLFHVIVLLVQKLSNNKIAITGSAAIGALTFAVSDSFWFSAVEGEVYALSMFFLILSFWAAFKWGAGFEKSGNEKWIYFLALITGLGIGVHLLNLLVLPSAVMIMGFKKYGYSIKNIVLFFAVGLAVLLGVLYVLTPVVMQTLAWFDFIFVNKLNLPLNSGALFGILFIGLILGSAIFYFRKKQKNFAEITVLSVLFILIGFLVYSVNIIRSSANPPVNFGQPDNMYSLINYLNREQYPKRPLLKGQNYNSPVVEVKERYSKNFRDGEYQKIRLGRIYKFDDKTTTFFPRMYSSEEKHIRAYNRWVKIKGKPVAVKRTGGNSETIIIPRFSEQLAFFIKYQFGYMFGRYFMWNFVGRQNDRQGRGEIVYGNWLSGINFIDDMRLGPQNKVPTWLKTNKGRNTYFFLPFIMGLIGACYQYKKHRESFFIVLALFIMGGLGLTVYINEIPITPRERDYVFVGAFLAFSIWVGLSFWAIINQFLKSKKLLIPVFALLLLAAPLLMAFQNYDDHDRSVRFAARDFAKNILKSCPPNAILFTSGDNDTYPMLYCQEVEDIRTDVRIVIMPFLAANWFVNGLRRPKYNDAGLKMAIPQRKYDYEELDFVPVLNKLDRDASWSEAFNFLQIENDNAKVQMNSGEWVNFLPVNKLKLTVNNEGKLGAIPITLKDKILYKHELVFWDIISTNIQERPVCFASKYEAQKHGLGQYLRCEGFVYRLVPEKSESNVFSLGKADVEKLYSRLMYDCNWGNISDADVYVDWNTISNFIIFRVRNIYSEVASLLLKNNQKEKAVNLLKYTTEQFPISKIPHDIFCIRQAEMMLNAGMKEEAMQWINDLEKDITETLEFYVSLDIEQRVMQSDDIQRELTFLNQLVLISRKLNDEVKTEKLNQYLKKYYEVLVDG